MEIEQRWTGFFKAAALMGAMATCGAAVAQQPAKPSQPDAQIEANVLKALASAPQLANQGIQTTTVYGTVTLSGNVQDDASRQMADDLTSRVAGVQKVIDEMTVGQAAQGNGQPDAGANPQLQSDGTMAPPPNQQGAAPPPPQQQGGSPYPQTGYPGAPEYPQNAPQQGAQGYPQQGPPQGYPQQGQQGYPPQQAQNGYPQQQGYSAPPANGGGEVYGAQRPGDQVTIAPGALLRVRINEGLSSNRNQAGASFDGIVLNDVVADGAVAIPRGASVTGMVVTAHPSGALKGQGELTLQLTSVILAGKTFPVNSDIWSRETGDKTAHTVNSALGFGVLGAIIGGVAGGGAGAAIGAGVGGATGVAASAASPRGQVLIPPEAILTFHIAQPTPVVTVSQAEMDRLATGVGASPQMRRRPPPPAYYGRPYPYPY